MLADTLRRNLGFCVGFFFVEAAFIFVDLWSLFLPSWAGWALGVSKTSTWSAQRSRTLG